MQHRFAPISRFTFAIACLVFGLTCFAAENARQFIGRYQISDVTEQGNAVHLTMRLQVFNYSGEDIRMGAVALYTSDLRADKPIGGFTAIKLLQNRRAADISEQFTVPAREYRRWREQGIKPALFFLSKDSTGKVLKRGITVSREIFPKQQAR